MRTKTVVTFKAKGNAMEDEFKARVARLKAEAEQQIAHSEVTVQELRARVRMFEDARKASRAQVSEVQRVS